MLSMSVEGGRKKLSGMGSLFLLWFPGISLRLSALYSTCLPAEPLHQLDFAVFKAVIILKWTGLLPEDVGF